MKTRTQKLKAVNSMIKAYHELKALNKMLDKNHPLQRHIISCANKMVDLTQEIDQDIKVCDKPCKVLKLVVNKD